jgi:hypothetical protein
VLLLRFIELVESIDISKPSIPAAAAQYVGDGDACGDAEAGKTVVIWLHHLLAASKRKLALSPPTSPQKPSPSPFSASGAAAVGGGGVAPRSVRGVTKPGYPGIMVFSGPKSLVEEHVATLRGLKWQAFSVRLEEDVAWGFVDDGETKGEGEGKGIGGKGVREVQSLAEVVGAVEEQWREALLRAVGVK